MSFGALVSVNVTVAYITYTSDIKSVDIQADCYEHFQLVGYMVYEIPYKQITITNC